MPAATACSIIGACSAASIVPRMMPSGFSAIAWVSAEARAGTEPWPSRMRKSQPMRLGRLLRAVADALGAAVPLVGRDVDDQLPALRLRTGGRAGPFGHRRGRPSRRSPLPSAMKASSGRMRRATRSRRLRRRPASTPPITRNLDIRFPPCELTGKPYMARQAGTPGVMTTAQTAADIACRRAVRPATSSSRSGSSLAACGLRDRRAGAARTRRARSRRPASCR